MGSRQNLPDIHKSRLTTKKAKGCAQILQTKRCFIASAASLRVFLADDHTILREGLKTMINAQPDMRVIGEADDGKVAWDRIRALQPPRGEGVDVVVMDVSMPEWSGAEATMKVKQSWPDSKVLALSMHEDKSYLRSLLEAGARGYVLKRSAVDDLIRAIRVVASGGTYLDPALASTVADALMGSGGVGSRLRGEIEGASISEREEEVLRLIAQGFTNKEIGAKIFLSVKTIETYKARAMKKLGLDNRADIIRFAVARGWLHNLE